MTVEETRAVMERYLAADDHDVSMMADDVVFRIMATGVEYRTGPAVAAMFDLYYRTAFEARSEARAVLVGSGQAVWEGLFIGRYVGTFEGIPATGREVRFPLCVCYDFSDGRLVEGRVYLETQELFRQVTPSRR